MPTPHKHAALIKQWADDPSQPVWIWDSTDACWYVRDVPYWAATSVYALGPKPTQPPRKTCVLAGVEFPMPATVLPAVGLPYWLANADGTATSSTWDGAAFERRALHAGLVHLTREAAEQHSKALLAANKAALEAAK